MMDAAEMAQAQLPRNGHGGLKLGGKWSLQIRWPTNAPGESMVVTIPSGSYDEHRLT